MDSVIFTPNILSITITLDVSKLTSNEALKDKEDPINYLLETKIKRKIGNKCIREGYVNKESINIVERTIGSVNAEQFNGSVTYNVRYNAMVCSPTKGMMVKCKVLSINKMGILAENKPLSIVVARQHQPNKSLLKDIDIGDEITVSIIASKYDLYSEEIISIGIIPSHD